MMKIKMQQDLLKQQEQKLQQNKPFDMFWDQWLKGGKGQSESTEGGSGSVWEEWLREKGLLPSGPDDDRVSHGWTEEPVSDLSEMEDDAWVAGGDKRPLDGEGFSSDEALGDDWDTNDEDDDDHGGEMMPLPNMV